MLAELVEAARAPLTDWPACYPDRRAIGYTCTYVPQEIIHAAGFTPVRLRGTNTPLRDADSQLQSFTCTLCRSALDQGLRGQLDFLAGVVFAHTCDAMQALADLWRINLGGAHWVYTVMLPANLGSPAARSYLAAELDLFRLRMADLTGRPITNDDLCASIAVYDQTRTLIQTLRGMRDRLNAGQFFAVLDAAQVMPRQVYNPLLAGLLEQLETSPQQAAGPRLLMVGATLDEPALPDLIEELGARVVADELCSGSRQFEGRVGQGDPIAALSEHFLQRPPCPTKFHPAHQPASHLLDRVRDAQAAGVVFVLAKFCEPHAFDRALVLRELDSAGIPHLLLEMEQTSSLEAMRTRLQAFIEIL